MNKKILGITFLILALDQVSKSLITIFMKVNESLTLIPNFFKLTLCYNTGAAWGLFANNTIVIAIGTIISLIIIYHFIYCFKKNWQNNIAFGLILGGLGGNLIDRIIFGYVRDFLDFYIFGYDFPIFNISDMGIVIGVILLIIAVWKGEDIYENESLRRRKKN